MERKKMILIVSAAVTAVCLCFFGWIGVRIWSNTRDVRKAAEEFTSLLQNGELEVLKLRFYAYSEENPVVFADGDGTIQVQMVTEQQLADRYGVDAVQGTREPSESELLLRVLMEHSTVVSSVGITIGQSSTMQLELTGPDLMSWFENMTKEEAEALGALSDGHLKELERRLADGEIPIRSTLLYIPMIKQNGRWRFEISRETESAFYGDISDITDFIKTDADEHASCLPF